MVHNLALGSKNRRQDRNFYEIRDFGGALIPTLPFADHD